MLRMSDSTHILRECHICASGLTGFLRGHDSNLKRKEKKKKDFHDK